MVYILKFLVSFFRKSDIVGKDIPAALDKSQSFILFCFNSCFILFLVASESCKSPTSFLKTTLYVNYSKEEYLIAINVTKEVYSKINMEY